MMCRNCRKLWFLHVYIFKQLIMRAAILATLVVLASIIVGVAVVYGAQHAPEITICVFISGLWVAFYHRAKKDGI